MTAGPAPPRVTIEPFRPGLAAAVIELLAPRASVAPEPATQVDTAEIVRDFAWPFPTFVAIDGDRVVGYVEGELGSWCADVVRPGAEVRVLRAGEQQGGGPACAWVDHIYVDPRRRRQGIGTALLQAFAVAAQAHGCTRVACLVEVSGGLADRIAFFRAVGLGTVDGGQSGTALVGPVPDVLHRAASRATG